MALIASRLTLWGMSCSASLRSISTSLTYPLSMGTPKEEKVLYRSATMEKATNEMSHFSFIYPRAVLKATSASAWEILRPGTTMERPHFSPALDMRSLAQDCHAMAALLSYRYSEKFSFPSRSLSQARMMSAAGSLSSSSAFS